MLILLVIVDQEFCFVHTIGAPGAQYLDHDHFVLKPIIGYAYLLAQGGREAEVELAFARAQLSLQRTHQAV